MNYVQTNWLNTGIIAFFGFCIFFAFGAALLVCVQEVRMWVRKKIKQLQLHMSFLGSKYDVLWKINRNINNEFDVKKFIMLNQVGAMLHSAFESRMVEMIFCSFIQFYEENYFDMKTWGWSEEHFPHGQRDVTDMYRWIKKIRPDNYAEMSKMIFDDAQAQLQYWGSHYEGFNFKIQPDGQLKIIPIDYIESSDKHSHYSMVMMKMQNALHDLDYEKALWLLDRRKHFGL